MARDFGKVRVAFWADERVMNWSERMKFVALYLLTSPHTNAIGVFRAPTQYISADTGLGAAEVKEAMAQLEAERFVNLCPRTGFVMIRNFMTHNPIENTKVGVHCIKLAMAIPQSVPFLAEFEAQLKAALALINTEWKGFGYPIDTLSKPNRSPEPEPEPEPQPEPQPEPERGAREKTRASPARQVWPESAVVPEGWIKSAAEQRKLAGLPEIDLRVLARMFANHYAADRGNPRTVTEYQAKWNNWALKEKANDRANGTSKNSTTDTIRELARMAAEADGSFEGADIRQ